MSYSDKILLRSLNDDARMEYKIFSSTLGREYFSKENYLQILINITLRSHIIKISRCL